jgi:phosphoglycerate dehydrogenase-like enzyme
VLLTPHAAGYTVGLGARVASEVSRALAAWIDTGALPHRVV